MINIFRLGELIDAQFLTEKCIEIYNKKESGILPPRLLNLIIDEKIRVLAEKNARKNNNELVYITTKGHANKVKGTVS